MKATLLILFAVFIDGLQVSLSWAFLALGNAVTAATPLGGAIGLGGLGCYLNSSSWHDIPGCLAGAGAGAVLGAAVSIGGIPLGVILGFVVDFCISATFGVALVALLVYSGMFYPGYLFGGTIFELIPGFDDFPGWTFMTIMCIIRKKSEEKSGLLSSGARVVVAGSSLSKGNIVSAVRGGTHATASITAPLRETTQTAAAITDDRKSSQVKMNLKNSFEGIKQRAPAGNNASYASAA